MKEKQIIFDQKFLKKELLKSDINIRKSFYKRFGKEMDSFLLHCSEASILFIEADKQLKFNKRQAQVFSFLHTALNDLFISLKLYISGYFIPSGNLVRHFIEAISLSLICYSCDDKFLINIEQGKYKVNSAPVDVVKYFSALNLDESTHKHLLDIRNWYHNYSHSTLLCTATYFCFSKDGGIYFWGSEYEVEKEESYEKEIYTRLELSQTLHNLILIICGKCANDFSK